MLEQDKIESDTERYRVRVGSSDRIVTPAAFRETMEVEEGDALVATIDEMASSG